MNLGKIDVITQQCLCFRHVLKLRLPKITLARKHFTCCSAAFTTVLVLDVPKPGMPLISMMVGPMILTRPSVGQITLSTAERLLRECLPLSGSPVPERLLYFNEQRVKLTGGYLVSKVLR